MADKITKKRIIREDENTIPKIYTILTEEVPSVDEIQFILQNIIHIKIIEQIHIIPNCKEKNNTFNGEWLIKLKENNINIVVKLFKGNSSCVDYLIFSGLVDKNVSAGDALCILESTKTNDTNSRNTAVNQRITKFMVFQRMFPLSKAICIMFYNKKWKQNKPSSTAIFGLRLMKSLNIETYHGENSIFENLCELYSINEFTSINEIMKEKNKIKEKKGNVSVKIEEICKNNYNITCKLDKGETNSCGKISHDPNVGLLSGLINFINKKDTTAIIQIQKHNIKQKYFDKLPNSKFWYATNSINILFENINNIKYPKMPDKYFILENSCSEKQSTILFSQVIDNDYKCIFSNHSGCALTNIKTNNEDICVERTMPRPDILFYNKNKNELLIVEGKIEKDIKNGIKQLSNLNLDRFIKLICKEYIDCKITKGLCITIDSIDNIKKYTQLEFPILFALDKFGKYICKL